MTIQARTSQSSLEQSEKPSQKLSEIDLSTIDLDHIKDLLAGRAPGKRKVTVKSLIESQATEIRSALDRGLTMCEIAETLQEGGLPIGEATLRKYLYLLTPNAKRKKRETHSPVPKPVTDVGVAATEITQSAASAPNALKRSLSRARHLHVQLNQQQGSSK